jgi:hypothetical protein
MVAELESLLEDSGKSPETQWRTRILIRSAQDADDDIWKRLYEYENNYGENQNYSRAQMASRKLHRDFARVHKQRNQILAAYEKQQQVEISFLSADEKKEEFFDRAMREREQEVNNIHSSMQKVNEIYSVRENEWMAWPLSSIFADTYFACSNRIWLPWWMVNKNRLKRWPRGRRSQKPTQRPVWNTFNKESWVCAVP